MIAALFICTLATSYELRAAAGVTPVQKVLQLMSEMKAKAIQEKQDEEVAFSSFKQWCTNTVQNKEKAIKKNEELIEQLKADIAAADSDVVTLTDEIEKLDAEIIQKTDDMKSTTEIRESEKADYEKTHLDYSESIDAVTRAEAVMSKQAAPTAQAMMLLQTVRQNKMVPAKAGRVLDSFLSLGAKQDPMSVSRRRLQRTRSSRRVWSTCW
jgi:chromosome segregation ATPase